jgi:hypothetical protein
MLLYCFLVHLTVYSDRYENTIFEVCTFVYLDLKVGVSLLFTSFISKPLIPYSSKLDSHKKHSIFPYEAAIRLALEQRLIC